jgi:hypothetical protein
MASEAREREGANLISRRVLIKTAGVAVGAVALAPRLAAAQTPAPMAPPSTITTPPRDFGPNAPPNVYFTDPDVLTIDPLFNGLRQPNAPIQRLWTARPLVRGAGVERPGPVPGVERYPEQPSDALARGQWPRDGVPDAVEQ